MVAINFTYAPAEYLIPLNLKISTIRLRNPFKEEKIQRLKILELYWHQRQPDCKLLGRRMLTELKVIRKPLIEFIHAAPPEVIYGEGFGFDRILIENYFKGFYDDITLGTPGEFYIVTWHPIYRGD